MEGHLRREVLLDSADEEELFSLWNFNHIDMTDNEEIIEDVFISFDALQTDISHVLELITFQSSENVISILKTSEQLLTDFRNFLHIHRCSRAVLSLPRITDPANELFLSLIGRENISEEDVAIRADEVDLASRSFLENGPLSDESVAFLRLYCEYLLAGVVKNSYLFLETNEDAHFGQFDLIDVEVVDVVSILSSADTALRAEREHAKVMKTTRAERVFIDW